MLYFFRMATLPVLDPLPQCNSNHNRLCKKKSDEKNLRNSEHFLRHRHFPENGTSKKEEENKKFEKKMWIEHCKSPENREERTNIFFFFGGMSFCREPFAKKKKINSTLIVFENDKKSWKKFGI